MKVDPVERSDDKRGPVIVGPGWWEGQRGTALGHPAESDDEAFDAFAGYPGWTLVELESGKRVAVSTNRLMDPTP